MAKENITHVPQQTTRINVTTESSKFWLISFNFWTKYLWNNCQGFSNIPSDILVHRKRWKADRCRTRKTSISLRSGNSIYWLPAFVPRLNQRVQESNAMKQAATTTNRSSRPSPLEAAAIMRRSYCVCFDPADPTRNLCLQGPLQNWWIFYFARNGPLEIAVFAILKAAVHFNKGRIILTRFYSYAFP